MCAMILSPNSRALDFRRAFHLAREIVGDPLAADRAVQAFEDQVRRFRPAQVAEHHFAAQARREPGLTMSLFAYFGAVPCVASKIAWPVM